MVGPERSAEIDREVAKIDAVDFAEKEIRELIASLDASLRGAPSPKESEILAKRIDEMRLKLGEIAARSELSAGVALDFLKSHEALIAFQKDELVKKRTRLQYGLTAPDSSAIEAYDEQIKLMSSRQEIINRNIEILSGEAFK